MFGSEIANVLVFYLCLLWEFSVQLTVCLSVLVFALVLYIVSGPLLGGRELGKNLLSRFFHFLPFPLLSSCSISPTFQSWVSDLSCCSWQVEHIEVAAVQVLSVENPEKVWVRRTKDNIHFLPLDENIQDYCRYRISLTWELTEIHAPIVSCLICR